MAQVPKLSLLRPAANLAEASKTLEVAPLLSQEELNAFYRKEIQEVRGQDRMEFLKLRMSDAVRDETDYKAFLLGHRGVGKTTELMRVVNTFSDDLEPLRISILAELNPAAFRYYDILLLILVRLVKATADPTIAQFTEHNLDQLLNRVRGHLSTKWTKYLSTQDSQWGAGLEFPFLKLLGNLRQGRVREQGEQEYEVSFVAELSELINDLLDACNELLYRHKRKRWIILVEDFDKLSLPTQVLLDVFLGLRPSLEAMRANLIITIPIWLYYSSDFDSVKPIGFEPFVVPDIPVYGKDHTPDEGVIRAMEHLVHSRMESSLLGEGVLRRCILASGGFLRDLFVLLLNASIFARLRKAEFISLEDLDKAIVDLRNSYKQSMGSTSSSDQEPSLDAKLDLLVSIYHRKQETTDLANPVLYRLLRQRFVLQYNGVAWLGVHPLVVDLLIQFKKLDEGSPGGSVV